MISSTCPDCGRPLKTTARGGLCPACLLGLGAAPHAGGLADEGRASEQPDNGRGVGSGWIDRYKLLEIIGEGGFGTVWMAEQLEPVRRKVALKIIKLGMDTRQVVARFEAERQALALMDHPNIARVFDAGATETGRPYFVMELVPGLPITEFCDARQLRIRERLELFIQVCHAVQHAHQKGVIHRDLKPSNILVVDQDGRPVPKVIDFGVSKAIEEPLTDKTLFTRFHQFLGTPAYMSPEQAGFGGQDVDTRTDIYALGVLLYELLAGEPPLDPRQFRTTSYEAILKHIREVETARPSTRLANLSPEKLVSAARRCREEPKRFLQTIRGDLDSITLKALEKDRTRRYESANGLAADVRRYLESEPIAARPPSRAYRLRKLARRNKLAFAATSAVAGALVIGLLAATWQAIIARRHLARSRLNAYVSEMNVAQRAADENNLRHALELLQQQVPRPGAKSDLRGFEWRYLWQACQPNALHSLPHGSDAVAFSPDGQLFAAASPGNKIMIYETASRRVVAQLPGNALSVAFSPRDKLLAVGQVDRLPGDPATAQDVERVRLWNTETWQEARRPLEGTSFPVRFSPDGAWLLSGAPISQNPRHRLWRTDTWEAVATCPGTPELPWQLRNAVSFSPDSKLVVTPWLKTTNGYCILKLWKVPSLELEADLMSDQLPSWSATFAPDGRHLLMGTFNGDLVVWDIPQRKIVKVIKENISGITSIAVAKGAPVFATTSHDHRVSLWDAERWEVVARFRGHSHSMWASALSPDGRLVVTGSFDGTTRLWDATARDSDRQIQNGSLIAGFTDDGQTLVLAPWEGDYRWHLVGQGQSEVPVPAQPGLQANYIHRPYDIFGPRPLGALGRSDGTLEFWDLSTGKLETSWRASANSLTVVTFSPDGTFVATGDSAARVKLWRLADRAEQGAFVLAGRPRYPGETQVSTLAFSPNGKLLAAGCWPGFKNELALIDLEARQISRRLAAGLGDVTTAAFSPDGRLLAAGAMGGSAVYLWDLPSGTPHRPLLGHVTGIVEVTFSPDGKTLATGGYDTVRLWNVATEREMLTLPGRGTFRGLAFSPDGQTLAAAYLTYPGHRVHLYRAPSLDQISAARNGRP